MSSRPARLNRITIVGEIAAAVAVLSARYLRTIGAQLSRVAARTYDVYVAFEERVITAATDLCLFVWALRNFALIIVLQVLLVAASLRWPIVWLPSLLLAIVLVTAAIEVAKRSDWQDDAAADDGDYLRRIVHFTFTALLRISLILAGLTISILYGMWRYEASHLAERKGSYAINRQDVLARAQPTDIKVRHTCSGKTLWVVANYRNRDGRWMTTGWYDVKAHAAPEEVVVAYSPRIYLYAFAGRKEWKALDSEPGKLLRLKYEKIKVIDNQISGKDVREARFLAADFRPGGEYTHVFSCEPGNS